MAFAMITLPPEICAGGLFLAHPSQIESSNEEVIAIGRREAPVERAAEIEGMMRNLAFILLYNDSPSDARH